ncbi:MAG: murein L,D-transpeptidase catalytic domain family protein [Polyangiaceae bacterium]|nr:murein L,D-transpeptidase catalytic domain family protein [Polyangiaceae bacterium]
MAGSSFLFTAALAPILVLAAAGCGGLDPDDQTYEPEGEDVAAAPSNLDISVFDLPPAGVSERAAIIAKYPKLDPTGLVRRGLLEDAMAFFDVNKPHIPKQKYFVVVDFAPHSGKDRFFLVNVTTGVVEPHKVAHGDGTDPDNDGDADYFGNKSGSHMSSLGFYLTAEIYDGTHPHSMRLDGLSPDGSPNGMANTNVRSRAIVVHEASYVDDDKTTQQGRSNGCFALDPTIEAGVVDRIYAGSMMYAATAPLHPPIGASGGAGGTGGTGGTGGAGGTGGTGGAGGTGGTGGADGTGGTGGSGAAAGGAGTGATAGAAAAGAGGAGPGGASGTAGAASPEPAAADPADSDESVACGAASIVGSTPAPRRSGAFFAALAVGLCTWRLGRRSAGDFDPVTRR